MILVILGGFSAPQKLPSGMATVLLRASGAWTKGGDGTRRWRFNEHPVALQQQQQQSKYSASRGSIKEELIALNVSIRAGSAWQLSEFLDADLLANLQLLTIVQMCSWADGVGPVFTDFTVIPAVGVVFYCQFVCS